MFRVLVSDKIAEEGLAPLLQAEGIELVHKNVKDVADPEEYSAILVRSGTKVTADVISRMTNLKIIGRAGVGVDNIDVAAASERGIVVVNAPGGNTVSTAEHTFAMMLALSRKIYLANNSLKSGEWNRGAFQGSELKDKTLGIIGFGRIGSEIAKRAVAFEMNVLGYSRSLTKERAEKFGAKAVDLDFLIANSDIITLHTALTDETRGLLNEETLKKTKPGVMIINCARGGIVDEAALKKFIESGHVKGAALDVFSLEPPQDFELINMEQVVVTPHIAASTKEAQLNVARIVAEDVLSFSKGEPVKNSINI
ncbi:MAG TPA: hypothetical protein GX528_05190 [Firmicutes bacterium]|nr:hypothetical protein [Bacillota bacterium]